MTGADNPIDAVGVVERFGQAWSRHDVDAALELITDDCVFEATSPAPVGLRHVGRAPVAQAWQAIFDDTHLAVRRGGRLPSR